MPDIYNERIKSTVNTEYIPYVVDSVLNSNMFFQRVVRAAKKWKGRTLRQPVKVAKNQTGQSFRGFDTFSVSATNNRVVMEFDPSFYQITCALPGDELSIADTEGAVLDLMKLTIQSDTEDMADDLGTMFYNDGTGNGGKDHLGLAALVDDGSAVATIGGVSRSTYSTLQSTVTASSGVISVAKMDTLYSAVSSGSVKPTSILTTETVYNFYKQLLRPAQRFNVEAGQIKGQFQTGTGETVLAYEGKPVLADEKCTSGAMIMLNENFVDFYALPFFGAKPVQYKSQVKGNDYEAPLGLGFSWTDWIKAQNSSGFVGHIYFGGQLITSNPKRHGKLTGITST